MSVFFKIIPAMFVTKTTFSSFQYFTMDKRGKNFTEQEKEILIEVVHKYRHIIESKKTDGQSTLKKKKLSKKSHKNLMVLLGL